MTKALIQASRSPQKLSRYQPRFALFRFPKVANRWSRYRALQELRTDRGSQGLRSRCGAGEVVVICGPSGSGKSTLIKCVNGLERFDRERWRSMGSRSATAPPT